jgi:hypothetical protein
MNPRSSCEDDENPFIPSFVRVTHHFLVSFTAYANNKPWNPDKAVRVQDYKDHLQRYCGVFSEEDMEKYLEPGRINWRDETHKKDILRFFLKGIEALVELGIERGKFKLHIGDEDGKEGGNLGTNVDPGTG